MSPSEQKKRLRTEFRQKHDALTPEAREAASAIILQRLQALPQFQAADRIFTYLSYGGEVNTWPLVRDFLAAGYPIFAPRRVPLHQLQWVQLQPETEMNHLDGGFSEPVGLAESPQFNGQDLAVVPGLAFTPQGDRLGQGGGYYDRFLTSFLGVKVGLVFSTQVVPHLPLESHDIRVDFLVTESTTYVCS